MYQRFCIFLATQPHFSHSRSLPPPIISMESQMYNWMWVSKSSLHMFISIKFQDTPCIEIVYKLCLNPKAKIRSVFEMIIMEREINFSQLKVILILSVCKYRY